MCIEYILASDLFFKKGDNKYVFKANNSFDVEKLLAF